MPVNLFPPLTTDAGTFFTPTDHAGAPSQNKLMNCKLTFYGKSLRSPVLDCTTDTHSVLPIVMDRLKTGYKRLGFYRFCVPIEETFPHFLSCQLSRKE